MNFIKNNNQLKNNPLVINLDQAAILNNNFRMELWTGKYLQTTLMEIDVNDDIGLELHKNTDQFLIIINGTGLVKMGKNKNYLDYQAYVQSGFGIFVPSETWHNLINVGYRPIKLISIYAPPNHPVGTIQKTKKEAEKEEKYYAEY